MHIHMTIQKWCPRFLTIYSGAINIFFKKMQQSLKRRANNKNETSHESNTEGNYTKSEWHTQDISIHMLTRSVVFVLSS